MTSPSYTPPQPTPTRPKRHTIWYVLGAIGTLIMLGSCMAALSGDVEPTPEPPAAFESGDTSEPSDPSETEAERQEAYTPKPKDFRLRIKTLKKECFGSAGCLVTYTVRVSYDGKDYGDRSFELTYKVQGPQDGPAVNTITVQGTEAEVPDEEMAQTPSSSVKLRAKVTEVEEL